MTDKYPNLAKMGISNAEDIVSYSVSNVRLTKDVLRLKYRRAPGSFLPITRGYEFDRTARASEPHGIEGTSLSTYEISPVLDGALRELESIIQHHHGRDTLAEEVLDQIDSLERDFAGEIASLRSKLKQLQSAK